MADFNGDGIDDLVVGVPGEDIGATTNAGAVNVIYGSESGLADGLRQQLTQALAEPGDGFGTAVATGDFNGDILTDLAVGVPGENLGGIVDAGAVEVFYGSGGVIGLPAVGDQLLRQGAAGMAGVVEAGDRFGAALATGLVDGAAGGLLGSGNVLITESQPEAGDGFGAAVEIGDMTDGGLPTDPQDLAVGAPGENVGATVDAGAAVYLVGPGFHVLLTQAFGGASESGDQFGAALGPPTSTATTPTTWSSGPRARTSARPPTPGR